MRKTGLLIIIVLLLCGCQSKNSDDRQLEPKELYENFLSGQTHAVDNEGNTISIQDITSEDTETCSKEYAIFDMNGDNIPELIIKTTRALTIFWVKNGEIVLWHNNTNYTQPLNNGTLLSERNGGAPEHTDYIYYVIGYQGDVLFKIEFSEYESVDYQGAHYNQKYLINNNEVNKDIYDSLVEPLLHIGDDKLKWETLHINN